MTSNYILDLSELPVKPGMIGMFNDGPIETSFALALECPGLIIFVANVVAAEYENDYQLDQGQYPDHLKPIVVAQSKMVIHSMVLNLTPERALDCFDISRMPSAMVEKYQELLKDIRKRAAYASDIPTVDELNQMWVD